MISRAVIAALLPATLAFACNSTPGQGFTHDDAGSGGGSAAEDETQAPPSLSCGKLAKAERVVLGYVPTYRDVATLQTQLDFDTLTHVAIAFGVPNGANGEIGFENGIFDPEIRDFITFAQSKGVKVLISIGGAAGSGTVAPFLLEDKLDVFVENILAFVEDYGFDGVDVDIESSHVDETYGPFVRKLADTIRPKGLLVTAAVAENFANRIDDKTMWCFDFVNIMSYDYAGAWSAPGDHSSYAEARNDLAYWTDTRGYAASRAVLGLPFYGYCWGSEEPCDGNWLVGFDRILERHGDKADVDTFVDGTITYNYNGTATIERKSKLGAKYGGVMIWDMGSDTDDGRLFSAVRSGISAE